MKKVVSWSFGRSSSYLVINALEIFGAGDVDVVAMDTGAEHSNTYAFAREFDTYIRGKYGKPITYLRTDFDTPLGKGNSYHVVGVNEIGPDLKPFSEMMAKYGTPYIGGMFCTDRMKLVPFTKYCNDKYGRGNYETWLGIRADEQKRLSKKKGIRYLAEISDFDKEDVLDFWSEMPFDLDLEEWNGNCVFCPKKSDLKLAAAQRDNPEMYHAFLSALHSDSVRHDERTGHWSQMYRGKKSLEQVVAMFDGSTGDEIKSRIRGGKMQESGSCSESCEVFNCQIDMFE